MSERRHKKTQVGTVVSDKMSKTRVVNVARLVCHPVFKKYYKRNTKFHVHDEKNVSDRKSVV